jgi:hypothetical protein
MQSLRSACSDVKSPAATESSSSSSAAVRTGSCSSITPKEQQHTQQQQQLLPLQSPYSWLLHLQQAASSNVLPLQQPLVCNQGILQGSSVQLPWQHQTSLLHPHLQQQQQQQPMFLGSSRLQPLSQLPTPHQFQQSRPYHPSTHRARVLTVRLQQQQSWQDLQLMYDASGGGARLNAIHLATVLQQLSRLAPMPELAPAAERRRLKEFTAEVGVIAAGIQLVCI